MVPPAATRSAAAAPSSGPRLRDPAVSLSRCPAVLLQGGPGLGPSTFFSRDCSHFGQPLSCNTDKSPRRGRGWGDTQGSGMLKARSPRCRAQPARRLRVAQLAGGTRTVRFQLAAEPEPGDWHPRTLRPRGAKYCVPREPRRPASRLPTMS